MLHRKVTRPICVDISDNGQVFHRLNIEMTLQSRDDQHLQGNSNRRERWLAQSYAVTGQLFFKILPIFP